MTMKKAKIYYFTLTDEMRKEEKLDWFRSHSIEQIEFHHIQPDKNSNWINLSDDNDWESLLPVCSKDVKLGRTKDEEKSVFKLFSTGYLTGRDEWVSDFSPLSLEQKMKFYINEYEKCAIDNKYNTIIKWSRNLKRRMEQGKMEMFNKEQQIEFYSRPFTKKFIYDSKLYIDERGRFDNFFGETNLIINFLCVHSNHEIATLGSEIRTDYCLLKQGNGGTQCLPLCRYDNDGNRVDNITDWALEQFRNHYQQISEPGFSGVKDKQDGKKGKKSGKSVRLKEPDAAICKENIFYYTYAVLHNPAYRKKYERNLKREFPRLPFYPDFRKWAEWGKSLMNLHIHYETVKPFPLKQIDRKIEHDRKLKVKLKADKAAGVIELDEQTGLHGIPAAAWEYRLGNRSALEWILDQYREKKPKDPTIAEKFNTYRFSDYKEHVIDLLRRVCTVSVETMKIIDEMREEKT